MKAKLYCIHDLVDKSYSSLHYVSNDDVAIRSFKQAVLGDSGLLNSRRQDFWLMCIGTFDTEKGFIEPLGVPELVYKGEDILE